MIRSAYHTVYGGIQYAQLLLSTNRNAVGKFHQLPPPETRKAVLIIPGWLAPGSAGDVFAHLFHQKKLFACTFHIGFQAVRFYRTVLKQLKEYLRDLRAACPSLEELCIVAHSMGGILALDAIADGVLDGLVVRFATLGTMHRGTWGALLGCFFSHSARELVPWNSRFKNVAMDTRLKWIPFLSIAGRHDLIVPSACCHHPMAQMEEIEADHGTLLIKRDVFKRIYAFFTEKRVVTPIPIAIA